jgi:uncharacterized protein with FMN-binding domain
MQQPFIHAVQRGLVALALTTLLGCSPKEDDPNVPITDTTQAPIYTDGTYTATGEYGGQPSHLTVTVSLQEGLIQQVQVQTHATNPNSLDYQRRFADAVPQVVVGKPLKDVKVSKLAGSSGCPIGFNNALDQIRQKATR